VLDVELVSYWDLLDRELLERRMRADAGVGQAGELETSIALALGQVRAVLLGRAARPQRDRPRVEARPQLGRSQPLRALLAHRRHEAQ
jgi:hypothetical protein